MYDYNGNYIPGIETPWHLWNKPVGHKKQEKKKKKKKEYFEYELRYIDDEYLPAYELVAVQRKLSLKEQLQILEERSNKRIKEEQEKYRYVKNYKYKYKLINKEQNIDESVKENAEEKDINIKQNIDE